jgi:REP element-mobilizing transposase RayT
MMLVLKEAKQKYGFRLLNFCIMPTHIHLLISPGNHADIPAIMRWIKTKTAKWWNHIHGATDHLWGERFFPRPVLGLPDYLRVMAYIDNNPVKAGLASRIGDYKDSGAFHIREGIKDIVDYSDFLTNFYPRALIAGR